MKPGAIFFCIICSGITTFVYSQPRISVGEYIESYKDLAIEEMETYHIPASITLAQGILESDCGNSPLALEAKNHFGIKCHKEWSGKTFYQDDDEKDECFRSYDRPEDSYRDHSEFLTTRDRYSSLFTLEITDYRGWAYGLKAAGYATNPHYPEMLIKVIEENGLDKYDRVAGRQSSVASNKNKTDSLNSTPNIQHPTLPPDIFAITGRGGNDRIIFKNNGVKFIIARKGDTFYKIADEFGIYAWQLFKYNDMSRKKKVKEGEKVYLEKKKAGAEYAYHIVGQGETLYDIAQDYGVRLKALCRRNNLPDNAHLKQGEKLVLN